MHRSFISTLVAPTSFLLFALVAVSAHEWTSEDIHAIADAAANSRSMVVVQVTNELATAEIASHPFSDSDSATTRQYTSLL
jgi:hypothetical protein